jgi:hypothetical protein
LMRPGIAKTNSGTQTGDTTMKLTGVVRLFAFTLLIGGSALLYAQDDRDAKPPQDEARPEATKPAHDAANPAKPEDAKPPKQDEAKPQPAKDMKPAAQAPAPEAGHNAQRQSGHIPDDKFRANFGRSHTVVIHQPEVVEGQPRFQFGGYWFAIVAPWPVGWAYTDDCYIDYVDGEYVLFDLLHPGVSVALIVVV